MKKLKELKLNKLSSSNLQSKEMNELRGGERYCTCSCYYATSGGSSSSDNRSANFSLGDWGGGYSSVVNNCYWEGEVGHESGVYHDTGYSC